MKIALILWDISKVGGILSSTRRLKRGFQDLGHEVETFFVSFNTRKLPAPKRAGIKYVGVDPAEFDHTVGTENEIFLAMFKRQLEKFDIFVFAHPCPTITKDFGSRAWQEIYKMPQPKIPIVHDPLYSEHYPWLLEVKDHITGVVCFQKKAFDAVRKDFPNAIVTSIPADVEECGLYNELKEDIVISPHQFKAWKNVDQFIRAIPSLNYTAEVYNIAIEYFYMAGSLEKRKEKYKDADGWIWEKALASGKMKYLGYVSNDEILRAFKRSKCMVDLSTGEKGTRIGGDYRSLNGAVVEAMVYGSIPVVRYWSLVPDMLSEDNAIVVKEGNLPKNTADAVNDIIKNFDNYADMRKRNLKLIVEKYDRKIVAQKILSLIIMEK
jgi:glycosyltransferase involved in cell wall biosynthesis